VKKALLGGEFAPFPLPMLELGDGDEDTTDTGDVEIMVVINQCLSLTVLILGCWHGEKTFVRMGS
jgi:hypothetical protein